jgi:signal peptidase I
MENDTITAIPKTTFKTKLLSFGENVLYIGSAVALAFIIQTFVVRPFIVSGSSMDPIIKNRQYLIIEEVSYRFHEPKRGDVIVFKAPPEPKKYYIKRIIGLPGDTVIMNGTKVTIKNAEYPEGFTLQEDFLVHNSRVSKVEQVVTEGHYFVMGDNRDGSYDSRSWKLLPKENIRGRALLRLLPINAISYLPGKENYEETR